jgi:hypothetical protein
MGSGAIYEAIYKEGLPEEMRKYLTIYEEAVSYMTLNLSLLNFLIYAENFIFFFISVRLPIYAHLPMSIGISACV